MKVRGVDSREHLGHPRAADLVVGLPGGPREGPRGRQAPEGGVEAVHFREGSRIGDGPSRRDHRPRAGREKRSYEPLVRVRPRSSQHSALAPREHHHRRPAQGERPQRRSVDPRASQKEAGTVGVRLVGDPRPRLESDVLTAVQIEPGKRESLVIPVRVIGGDPLRVRVEILDREGGVLTTGGAVELRTTAYARAARWFTVGAAILLGLMVVFDIWRRVRRRSRPAAA